MVNHNFAHRGIEALAETLMEKREMSGKEAFRVIWEANKRALLKGKKESRESKMKTTREERLWAGLVARSMGRHNHYLSSRARSNSKRERERLNEKVYRTAKVICFNICMLCEFDTANLARSFQLIALALEGKLRGTKNEEAVLKAVERALARKRKRSKGPGLEVSDLIPDRWDVIDLLPVVCTEAGLKKVPHPEYVSRLLKKLDQHYLAKPGPRPSKK